MLYVIFKGNFDLSITNKLTAFSQLIHFSEWMISYLFFPFARALLCVAVQLCLIHFLRPLLHIIYQPIPQHTQEINNICILYAYLGLSVESLIVSLAGTFYSVKRS